MYIRGPGSVASFGLVPIEHSKKMIQNLLCYWNVGSMAVSVALTHNDQNK